MVVKEDAGMEDVDYIIRGKVTNILVECRKEKGVTQRELADAMGSKENTVASWEQGKSLPNIQTLYRLSKYYNKTIGYMFGEKEA
jgi:transcriptional regulator with XRE-family HTH domain